jgi:asparagine synthase (glutamine-hydrolysing)
MCGIFGFHARSGSPLPERTFNEMGQKIIHRGPDDTGTFYSRSAGIGNQRLSIIDVEGGGQPFYSSDGNVVLVQNGEIYNHVELAQELAEGGVQCKTSSDTEVLLHLYQKHGIDFLSKLNGMFCIAIYDKNKDELILARDRVGVKPLFVHNTSDRLLFGSEIKSVLAAGVEAKLNEDALQMFLAYNYVPPPHTIFEGISHLSPGHYLVSNSRGVEVKQWWDLLDLAEEVERPEKEWADDLHNLLDDAVRLRMRADVPFGAFLSGGVDSGTVVGLMSRHSESPIQTYCIGFDDERFDESVYAKKVADMYGCNHRCEIVGPDMISLWPMATYHCDQPHGDVSFLPTYRVSKLAATHVKMVLTGDGGDELFAGYDKYKTYFGEDVANLTEHAFFTTYCDNISLFSDEERGKLMLNNTAALGVDVWQPVEHILNRTSKMSRINQALLVDVLLLLPGNNLVKPDRMGMAVSLEARTPFLDYRLVELAFKMPGQLKLKDGVTKHILKKVSAPIIGEDLAYRKKQMFTVPVGEWFKDSMSDEVKDLLISPRAVDRKLFDQKYVRRLIEDHTSGKNNNTREIRALIAVELWHRCFLDAPREAIVN